MKILHINEYAHRLGGAEAYLHQICESLQERGHDCVLLSSADAAPADGERWRQYRLSGSHGLRSAHAASRQLKRVICAEAPDVVHLHNTHYFLSPLLLSWLRRRVPCIQTIHDTRPLCPSVAQKVLPSSQQFCPFPVGRRCFQQGCYPFDPAWRGWPPNLHHFALAIYGVAVLRCLDQLIVSSDYMRRELTRNGVPANQITQLPLFTDAPVGPPAVSARSSPRILFVGRLDVTKGIWQLIATLKLLGDLDWHADIVGAGDCHEAAEATVRQLGMGHRITFHGTLTKHEIARHYQMASVVVMPSMIPESFGLVGLEAMAFARPVIAFDCGAICEWLADGETGYLVPRGDTRLFAERLRALLLQPEQAFTMGRQGLARLRAHYRKDRHIAKLVDVYQTAVASRPATRDGLRSGASA